ncbi:AP2 domain transcription factor AP2X-1 [Toxoplasma gondii ME49]|uniref:AP2 domain transcription factor AP2X-1 n=5 Tax=Toxoplasma gondii TaxID=5811 RepID=S8G6D4_TOXGM|nr:AP2 domain transcription factor AP2X-1 [Toxoplasma gondii ME49]EPT27260.1 AP2 domain transcription factor AP2X-1 [Toxoplasma gondii ME49]|eukprot:XP_018636079.1 AP2 domain transcription factor AP2X-1 [Toxoplasma gondii ME49]
MCQERKPRELSLRNNSRARERRGSKLEPGVSCLSLSACPSVAPNDRGGVTTPRSLHAWTREVSACRLPRQQVSRPLPRRSLSRPRSEPDASPVKGPGQRVEASAVEGGPSASSAERLQVDDGLAAMRKTKKGKGEEGGEETERWATQAVEQQGTLKPAGEETAVPGASERSASPQQAMEGSCGVETPETFFGVSTGNSQGSPSPESVAGEEARPERENAEKSATGGSASKAKKPSRESARRPDTALIDRHLIAASPSPSSARRSSTCSPSPHSREGEDKPGSGAPPASSPSANAGALEPAEKGTLGSPPQDVLPALPASSSSPSTGGGSPLSPPPGQAPRAESGAPGSGALSLRRSLRHRQPVRPAAIAVSPLGGPGSSLSSRSASPTRRGGVSPCGPATAVGKGAGAASGAAALPGVGAKAPPSATPLAGLSGRSLLASVSPSAAALGPGAPGKKKAGQVQGAAKARGAPPFVLAEYWPGVTLDEMEKGELSWARAAAGLPLPASPHKVPGGPAPPVGGPPARDEDSVAACAGEKGKEKAFLGSGRSQAAQGLPGIDAVAAACWGGAGVDSRVLAPAEGEASGAFGPGGEKKKVHASSDSSGGSRAALGGRASVQGKARKPAGWEEERGRRDDRSRGRRDETDGPRFDVTWFVDDSPLAHTRKRTRWDSLWVRPASPVRVVGDSAPEESPERREGGGRAPDLQASMAKRRTADSGLEEEAQVERGFSSSDSDDCDWHLPTRTVSSSLAPFAASKAHLVPRCCYCLLPRRLPGRHTEAGGPPRDLLGWSTSVESEETRGRYLQLYCACTKRPFGESVLQGAAGRRGLLLPVATNALLYSVRRVALDGAASEQKSEALPTSAVSRPSSAVRARSSCASSGCDDGRAEVAPGAPAETIYRWRDPCTLQTFSSSLDRIQGSLAATAAVAAAAESAGKPVAFLPRLYWDSQADCYIASCLRWEEEAQPTPAAERGEKRNGVERPAEARERGRDEKKPEDPSVPGLRRRSLKLLQKKFSVAFLGDAKAHFYASEWLKWQHKGQRMMDEEDRRQEVARQMLLVSPLLAGRKAPAKAPGGCSKKASSLSAAQLALASGRPLTPEEEAELKRQLENKERQKKQKLLRQQWRRQQAREAKLRLREAEAAAAAAAAAGAPSAPGTTGASQTRSPQSQQKSESLPVLRSKTEVLQPSPGASFAPASSRSTLPAGESGAAPCEGVGTRRSAASATSVAPEKVTGRKSETARDAASASLEAAKSTMVTRGGGRGSSVVAVTRSTSSPSGRAASVASSTLGGFGAR